MNYVQIIGVGILAAIPLVLLGQPIVASAALLIGFTFSEHRIRNGRRAG